jgi:hypothetical protein
LVLRRVSWVSGWILAALAWGVAAEVHPPRAARAERLELRRQSLELPGAPASLVSTDLDGDGRRDLVIVVVYREWGEIGEDRFEDMMEIVEVVPALFDRREIHAYLAGPDGRLRMAGPPLPIDRSVLSVEAGPPGIPAIALTDAGVSKLSLSEGEGPALVLEPLLEEPPVMAGSETYLPKLSLVHDIDGDGLTDLLFPARDAIAIHRGTGDGLATSTTSRLVMPGFKNYWGMIGTVSYPLPTIQDVDGDGLPDLVVQNSDGRSIHVMPGEGGGEFAEPAELVVPETKRDENSKESGAELAHFGDVDGSGTVEIVTLAEVDTGKSDIKEAKKPKFRYRFYRVSEELAVEETPYQTVDVEGYPFGAGDWPEITEAVFRDLDRDGREDVVTVTLRFSVLQVVKILATKKVGVGVDFHIYRQGEDGKFREVSGLDLREKLKIDLNDFKLNRFAQFAGDFDGDGLSDFVRMGGSRTFTIHRGEPGCRYSKKADLTIELEEEPLDLALVQIRDIDGDDRADLLLSYPVPPEESELVAPVRLELYFSGAAE